MATWRTVLPVLPTTSLNRAIGEAHPRHGQILPQGEINRDSPSSPRTPRDASGASSILYIPTAFDAVILTFDRGLAEMREFFEHVDTDEILLASSRSDGITGNSRARLEPLHPRLEYMRPRLVGWVEDLHQDAAVRLTQGELRGLDDLQELVRVEEQLLLVGEKRT